MPELPEVETTRRGISPFLLKQTIIATTIRQRQLRLAISRELATLCPGQEIQSVRRRGKYLIFELSEGYLLNHLGMSGHLRIVNAETPPSKHSHLDLQLSNGCILRYNDPRRFGLWLFLTENPDQHYLLAKLGPEPLSNTFNGKYLFHRAQHVRQNIKSFIMKNEIVVGVGNIYATESLFLAGIHPQTPAFKLKQENFAALARNIKQVLQQAIAAGGTTLRDFHAADGKPGYFSTNLQIYGRKNLPCFQCNTLIQAITIAGRNSAFCPSCQGPLLMAN
jgi:formamidopyrimidine-DNA glycosylase